MTDDRIASAEQLLILGRSCQTEGRHEEAIKNYEEAVQIADETNHGDIKAKAYQHLGNVFVATSEYKKAIEYYQKARKIFPQLEGDAMEEIAYQTLGYNHLHAGQYQESIEYYNEALKLSIQLGCQTREASACLMLGHAFRHLNQHEKAVESYQKALSINKELNYKEMQMNHCEQVQLEGIINEWCGYCCRFIAGQDQEAITFYVKAKEIAKNVGEKCQEYRTNQAIGNIFCNIGNFGKAMEYLQEALKMAVELRDKHCESTSCLNLASVCGKDCDYEMAIKWYRRALGILETEFSDHLLKEKVLTGLGIAWFNLGNTRKATKSIRKARKFAKEGTDRGNYLL
jgi:tetratricopeptide (TPR) repeat protein